MAQAGGMLVKGGNKLNLFITAAVSKGCLVSGYSYLYTLYNSKLEVFGF
jgi:hypothetical protein